MTIPDENRCRLALLGGDVPNPDLILTLRRIGAAVVAFIVTFLLGAHLDLAERFTAWAAAHETWEVDELPVAFLAAAVSFAVLAALERRLYRREAERRRETERKLRQAMEIAVTANTSKSAFLASISHELRTPLNAIVGFSDFMRQGALGKITPHQYLAYVQDIYSSSKHLLNLVEKILDISKIEAGKYDLQRETVRLARLADEAGRIVNHLAVEKGLRIDIDIADDLDVFADPQAARQILINLWSNAVKFNRSGGRIAVSAMRESDRLVAVSISDTGCGIDPGMLPHVFEPFAQASPFHARQTEGAGLGLSIVKHLAELHGGDVRVNSEPGLGTTVVVRLPDRPAESVPSTANDSTPAHTRLAAGAQSA